jgi:hypothetical protein
MQVPDPVGRRALLVGAAATYGTFVFGAGAASAQASNESGVVFEYMRVSSRGAEVNGEIAVEEEGSQGISSITMRTGWTDTPPMRLRLSRAEPDHSGAQHLLIVPYQYGMAIDYPGVVETWVTDWSIHGRGQAGARLWVGNHDDTGGLHLTASRQGEARFGEIVQQLFTGASGGELRFTVRDPDDSFVFRSGPIREEKRILEITPSGISFGASGPQLRHADDEPELRLTGRFIAEGGFGIVNAQRASTLGPLSGTFEVFDGDGVSLGHVPIFKDP